MFCSLPLHEWPSYSEVELHLDPALKDVVDVYAMNVVNIKVANSLINLI